MTRRAVGSAQSAVSLFPFLAVLLCTMGSLILLLIVIARQARDQRDDARITPASPAEVAAAAQRSDELNWEIEQLTESRRKTAQQLAEQRAQLSHLEEHAQRLRGELAELENAERLLSSKKDIDETERERLLAEIAEMRRRAAEVEAKLAEAKAKGRRPPAFAILPYDGENGTRRRPIYIECRGDAVILQPEGIVFSEADFGGSLGPSNPLAACLRVTAEHYARAGNMQPDEQPYPLLLVRPDGIGAYYAARAAMSTWDSDFGYELIDADWPLEFPPADGQLTQLLARTQDEARRRQVLIARAAPSLQTGARPSFRMTSEGGGNGNDGNDGRYGAGNGTGGGERYPAGGAPGMNGSGNGLGPNGAPGPGGLDPLASGNGSAGGGPGDPLAANGNNTGGGLGTPGTETLGSGAPGTGTPGANAPGSGVPGSGTPGSDGGPQLFASGQGTGSGSPNTGTAAGNDAATSGPGGQATNGNPNNGNSNQSAGGPSGTSGGSSGTGGSPESASGGPAGAAGGQASAGGGGAPSLNFGAQPSSSQSGQAGTTTNMQSPAGRNVESLANKRGKNWGLTESEQKSTAVTRPVQIYCSSDRLTIISDRGTPDRQIMLGPRTEDAVDELVTTVRSQIGSWGIAGRGMYWKPVLSMHVAPDGTARYQELSTLLAGSGLEVTGKPITVSGAATPGRR